MILDMMLQLYIHKFPLCNSHFTDHSNYDTISNISKDIYEVLEIMEKRFLEFCENKIYLLPIAVF